jgi:hypothetical protein
MKRKAISRVVGGRRDAQTGRQTLVVARETRRDLRGVPLRIDRRDVGVDSETHDSSFALLTDSPFVATPFAALRHRHDRTDAKGLEPRASFFPAARCRRDADAIEATATSAREHDICVGSPGRVTGLS